jgi:hypothetical protein
MLTILQISLLSILIRYYALRRRLNLLSRTSPHRKFYPYIRNIYFEYKLRETYGPTIQPFVYESSILSYIDILTAHKLSTTYDSQVEGIEEHRAHIEQPLQLYSPHDYRDTPDLRIPKPGLALLEARYFRNSPGIGPTELPEHLLHNDPSAAEEPLNRKPETYSVDLDLSGFPPHPEITRLIQQWTPHFLPYLSQFCRPYSYGPQAFYDFNRTTETFPPPTTDRENDILYIISKIFNCRPYQPLHFADTLAAKFPLSTSASYHEKKSPRYSVLSRYNSPSLYASKPSKKGHHINTTLIYARQALHQIKESGTPFGDNLSDALIPDSAENEHLQSFIKAHPTELFIRSQISKSDPNEPKKIRPVYAAPLTFLLIEIMLTYCFIVQLRNSDCAVMHGLETFRGAMFHIDRVALNFINYISLDWSQYDQRLPFYVIVAYFTRWLPSLIIINKGYAGTHTYPDTRFSDPSKFAIRIFHLLQFALLWYINMVFISYDGYAYVRLNAGVPSGIYNTQPLDSFGNMYIIADCLLEFGFTIPECLDMIFFILGDDNVFFTNQKFNRICDFMQFLNEYAKSRHGMIVSVLKSVFTQIRTKIEVLGYTNNYGMPTRPLGKLVAQLAFPEREVKHEWQHAARALGLAQANVGQDHSFHMLCYFVYKRFKPAEPIPTAQLKQSLKYTVVEHLGLDTESEFVSFPPFPEFEEIRSSVSYYHGSFHETDKWNWNIFTNPPSTNASDVITLSQWLQEHPEYAFRSDSFMRGYQSTDFI